MEKTMYVNMIAKIAHETNRAYCQANGDTSQLPWEESPQWQRDSCVNGVKFHIDNPGVTPEQTHENWMKQKEAEGWVYGEVKDPEKKQHPCMLPYKELPPEQRAKDHIFKAVVGKLLELFAGVITPELPLSKAYIESLIEHKQFHRFPNTTHTLCCLTLKNGFTVTGESACVDESHYDQTVGENIALENAIDKIWSLEGYRIKQKLYEQAL